CYSHTLDLHSFPTRRSSDLKFGPIITHPQIKTPFTFLNCIYVNKEIWKKREVDQAILFHEQAHVQQKHTLDVLFIEILKIFFWRSEEHTSELQSRENLVCRL